MRALFSLAGLLVVLAIVVLVARKQLQAAMPSVAPSTTPTPGAAAQNAQEQTHGVHQKMLQDVNRALEQGAARSEDTKP
jgi:hypothetical protein